MSPLLSESVDERMAVSVLDRGSLPFSVEGRILRELGERLVKKPEVALVELVKNCYDADATSCTIDLQARNTLTVADDGLGMTLHQFKSAWMRIGTRSKADTLLTHRFRRRVTGEKGIGRFAVRFLGRKLHLESVADDLKTSCRTRLTADFDWPEFDRHEDLRIVKVPYVLELVDNATPAGTVLTISSLRYPSSFPDLDKVRTGSIDILSPLGSLLEQVDPPVQDPQPHSAGRSDPGFALRLLEPGATNGTDVGTAVLGHYTLRARLTLSSNKIHLMVGGREDPEPMLTIVDTYPTPLSNVSADIRFFPRRSGAFAHLPIDGRRAYSWIREHSGVAVFDRRFRVSPYGTESDDWLRLDEDTARNSRDPRSGVAKKHFPMPDHERSTSANWMLRLPQSAQLVGLVAVEGQRTQDSALDGQTGLIPAADRHGFVENRAFRDLWDLVRGSVEAIAHVDRRAQLAAEQARRDDLVRAVRQDAKRAVAEVQANQRIPKPEKDRIVALLARTDQFAEFREQAAQDRERQFEVMSLLGVVAGFMTHEFGVALEELEDTRTQLVALGNHKDEFRTAANALREHIAKLEEFVAYATGYIRGSKTQPTTPYPVLPRLRQVQRIFGKYARASVPPDNCLYVTWRAVSRASRDRWILASVFAPSAFHL